MGLAVNLAGLGEAREFLLEEGGARGGASIQWAGVMLCMRVVCKIELLTLSGTDTYRDEPLRLMERRNKEPD